ncbi:hypothetical protein [Sebaldella sp. S0638]|uniref:hypothetical protein n=1 Tax=Sebaldella sp. S0638 TaxID=2957809 RepID=UPI0020A09F52|nr:hypothetical protein [Sebaldella sp. S0638]MCP1225314.1 hypothetical protein [Sebaldella sp. S0638]
MNTGEKLSFLCNACNKTASPKKEVLDKFDIIAYDSMVEWSDFTKDDDLENKGEYWQRSMEIPVKNESKIIRVHFPFNFETGESFWLLFMPGTSFFNGWEEHPEEIDQSAIVQCRFDNILYQNENNAWIEVKISDVIPLLDVAEKFTPKQDISYLDSLKNREYTYMFEYKHWIYHSWGEQGDIGGWGLIHKHSTGKNYMILFNEWSFHYDNVYCGSLEVDL